MLSIYLSITHRQLRSSRLCLPWSALCPIKIWKLFIYLDVKFDLVCLGLTYWGCGVWCVVHTLWPHTRLNWTNRLLTASSLFTSSRQPPVGQTDQHCNFRKNTDQLSSNSGSEQPQRNARHSSPYQNQVSRPGQENLEKFKFANWRKILWRKKCWPLQRDKTTFYFVLLKNFSLR